MYYLDGRWRRQQLVYFAQVLRLIRECRGRCLPGGARVCSRASIREIFGRGDRPGCILNFGHAFRRYRAYL